MANKGLFNVSEFWRRPLFEVFSVYNLGLYIKCQTCQNLVTLVTLAKFFRKSSLTIIKKRLKRSKNLHLSHLKFSRLTYPLPKVAKSRPLKVQLLKVQPPYKLTVVCFQSAQFFLALQKFRLPFRQLVSHFLVSLC